MYVNCQCHWGGAKEWAVPKYPKKISCVPNCSFVWHGLLYIHTDPPPPEKMSHAYQTCWPLSNQYIMFLETQLGRPLCLRQFVLVSTWCNLFILLTTRLRLHNITAVFINIVLLANNKTSTHRYIYNFCVTMNADYIFYRNNRKFWNINTSNENIMKKNDLSSYCFHTFDIFSPNGERCILK